MGRRGYNRGFRDGSITIIGLAAAVYLTNQCGYSVPMDEVINQLKKIAAEKKQKIRKKS